MALASRQDDRLGTGKVTDSGFPVIENYILVRLFRFFDAILTRPLLQSSVATFLETLRRSAQGTRARTHEDETKRSQPSFECTADWRSVSPLRDIEVLLNAVGSRPSIGVNRECGMRNDKVKTLMRERATHPSLAPTTWIGAMQSDAGEGSGDGTLPVRNGARVAESSTRPTFAVEGTIRKSA